MVADTTSSTGWGHPKRQELFRTHLWVLAQTSGFTNVWWISSPEKEKQSLSFTLFYESNEALGAEVLTRGTSGDRPLSRRPVSSSGLQVKKGLPGRPQQQFKSFIKTSST